MFICVVEKTYVQFNKSAVHPGGNHLHSCVATLQNRCANPTLNMNIFEYEIMSPYHRYSFNKATLFQLQAYPKFTFFTHTITENCHLNNFFPTFAHSSDFVTLIGVHMPVPSL